MLVAAVLIIATLVAVLALALLWRRECRRDAVPLRPFLLWFPGLLGLIGAVVFITFGMTSGALQWLQDVHKYQPQAQELVAGKPLDELKDNKFPLLGLIHALQAQLMQTPSADGWASLSTLYAELARQSGLDIDSLAVEAAKRALEENPADGTHRLLLAQRMVESNGGKLTEEAHQQLKRVLENHPEYDGAWLLLGMSAARAGQYETAETAFKELLKHHPDDKATALLQKSLKHMQLRQKQVAYYGNIQVTIKAGDEKETTGGTLFVFIREPGTQGQPLAAKRVLVSKLPLTVTLTAGDWLQAMPVIGSPLVIGGRYSTEAASNVASAKPLDNVPLESRQGKLVATLHLP